MRKPRKNEKVQLKESTYPDHKYCIFTVKEVRWDFVDVKPYRQKGTKPFEVHIDDIVYLTKEILSGEEKNQILKRLLRFHPKIFDATYKTELRTLKILLDKYPDLDFWRNFNPGFQVESMLWWIGGGKMDMEKYYNEFGLDFKTKNEKIEKDKVGEDKTIKKTITLREWLD